MAIRITQSMMYSDMVGQMQKNLADYMESNEQGSSQKKINRPSDDPAGTYRVLTARDDISATSQYQTNVDTATGWLNLADGVLSTQVSTLFQELESLAQQASSGEMSPENRKQIGVRVKEIFGQILNLSNTEFEGKSIFAGHKYDQNAFEEGLALTSWDTEWADDIKTGDYTIQGASSTSMMVQFTSTGNLDAPATYRWSKDGGTTWTDGTVQANAGPPATYDIVADGVTVSMNQNVPVKAADVNAGPGAENGTLLYIRPTAIYQGDDKDPPPETNIMGGPTGLTTTATGHFGKNMLVRFDSNADLTQGPAATPPTPAQDFTWSYSTDGGNSWVTARGQTTGDGTLRLPVPGGYMDLDATATAGQTITAGTQVMVHPSRADLEFEILKDTYISVNGVGKDIFGGYYQGKPAIEGDANLFEVVGNLIAYCENNNATGCGQSLAALKKSHERITTEADRYGGLENRVEMASSVLVFQKLDQQERLSYTEDIDLTELLTKLTRQQLTYQTVLQSSSMIMKLSLANYV